jgi:hypothetical protein
MAAFTGMLRVVWSAVLSQSLSFSIVHVRAARVKQEEEEQAAEDLIWQYSRYH